MAYLDRNDIAEEQFTSFAYFDVHEHVINDAEKMYYFSQTKNEVVIESKRNKCIFRKCGDAYRLQYLVSEGLIWFMHDSLNTSQIIFKKKVGKKLYFTHLDQEYQKRVDVIVSIS